MSGVYTNWTTQSAHDVIEKYTKEHPGEYFDAVFGQNDRIAMAARELMLNRNPNCLFAGVDALATRDGGIVRVAEGKLVASYIYPTRGDMVMDLALSVLQGKEYERETYLKSALVTAENADVMLTQIDELDQMQSRTLELSNKIDSFVAQLNSQRWMFVMALTIALLVIFIIVNTYRTQARKRQQAADITNERLRFFTNVSHEFRTPLTLISDPLQRIAATGELSEGNSHLLELARRQVDVMLQLVGQILDLRKIQNNKMDVKLRRGDLAQCLRHWTEGFLPLATTRGITIHTVMPQTLEVAFDQAKVERVAYNLLSNAMKYAPSGSRVEVTLVVEDGKITIKVQDHGDGIPEKEQRRIFNRFYQASNSASGTGIGLSLVYELVTLMQGEVSVDSKPGQGTTFIVTLPVDGDVVADVPTVEAIVNEEQTAQPQSAADVDSQDGPLVLVVDDNPDVLGYLHEVLAQEGYRIIQAADGQEGLDTATREVPDIIISDVMMPVMDGHELCRRVKSQTPTSHIPVLLLTAQALDDQRADGYDTGADGYITKPFSSRVLLSRIHNLLTNRRLLKNIFATPLPQPATEPSAPEPEAVVEAPAVQEDVFLASFRQIVEEQMADSDFSVEVLADKLHLSRVQMYRKIKALTGKTPVELIREARLLRADEMLHTGRYTVSEIAYTVGFSSPSYFTKCYKEHYGHTPGEK